MTDTSQAGASHEPGSGSDGIRSANDDRSDSLNSTSDAHAATQANQAEQAKQAQQKGGG
jgi:hypothetical protein